MRNVHACGVRVCMFVLMKDACVLVLACVKPKGANQLQNVNNVGSTEWNKGK
jgi:hypothetical protein